MNKFIIAIIISMIFMASSVQADKDEHESDVAGFCESVALIASIAFDAKSEGLQISETIDLVNDSIPDDLPEVIKAYYANAIEMVYINNNPDSTAEIVRKVMYGMCYRKMTK